MSKFDFSPVRSLAASAITAENKAHDAWVKLSKGLYGIGLRYAMIAGKSQDKERRAEVSAFIVDMMPEAKRTLLKLKGRDVAELTETQKVARKMAQQRIGVYLSRIGKYLGNHEGITVERSPKKAAAQPAPTETPTIGGWLQGWQAQAAAITKLPGLSAADAEKIREPLMQCIALLTAAKKAADKLAK